MAGFKDLGRLIPTELTPSLKIWLNRFGAALGIAGVIFIAVRLYQDREKIGTIEWSPGMLVALVIATAVFAMANLALALGWREVLRDLGCRVTTRWCIYVYAVTQIGKYVPGNVVQFAGRQIIGAAIGLRQRTILISSMIEILILSLLAVCISPIALVSLFPAIPVLLGIVLAFAAFLLIGLALFVYGHPHLMRGVGFYAVQVVVSALVFLTVLSVLRHSWPQAPIELVTICASYSVAWLAGMLTPGAPAGLGIREAILVLLLQNQVAEPIVLSAVVMGRVVTTVGDLLFYLIGRSFKDLHNPPPAQIEPT